MKYKELEKIKSFDKDNLPSVSECVKASLQLFIQEGFQKLDIDKYKKPLVLGSGNALNTAKIIFEGKNVIFGNENNFKDLLSDEIDVVLIFSASGEKHAPIMGKYFKDQKVETHLITCNRDSSAEKILGGKNTIITSKNREPYTYNTSTYMGWIFSLTKEDPKMILEFIEKNIEHNIDINFNNYDGYIVVVPEKLSLINNLLDIKFKELFGRRVARDLCTYEEIKHAVTVVPYNKEMCIKFGDEDLYYDGKILEIPLPKNCGPAAMMAIGYFVIGKVQEKLPQYFRQNIEAYIKKMNNTDFGKNLSVIVE